MTTAIDVRNLGREFSGRWVLRGVSFTVEEGKLVSLLGPNGAGKTTLVRILSTELMPSEGEAYVLGRDVVADAQLVRRRIATIPQESKPIGFLTPEEFVYSYLLLRGFPRREARKLTKWALEELGLDQYRHVHTYFLSGGYKRRVLVAAVLASNADVVFLDEPTVGLDPVARRETWDVLLRLRASGRAILLTTHYIEEAERLSDEVIVISSGRIVLQGSPQALIESLPGKIAVEVVSVDGPPPNLGHANVRVGSHYVMLVDEDGAEAIARWCIEKGCHIRVRPKTLEDVVMREIGEWD